MAGHTGHNVPTLLVNFYYGWAGQNVITGLTGLTGDK